MAIIEWVEFPSVSVKPPEKKATKKKAAEKKAAENKA
jgi:hypothetical protein